MSRLIKGYNYVVFIKHRSVFVYFSLAFIISWGLIGILAGPGNIPINPEESEQLLPLLYVSMLFGPSVAGLLMIGLLEGKNGFRRLISHLIKWRLNTWWYVFALFATPLVSSLILFALSFLNPDFEIGLFNSDDTISLILNGIVAGMMVGIFEELGWTGFVIPRLNLRYNILTSGLLVGVLWGLWHFILFWEKDSFSGVIPILLLLGRLFAWLPPYRILMVWLYNRTESILIIILTHVSLVFTTTVIVPMTLTGKALLTWIITWGVILWISAFVVLIVNRRILLKQSTYSKTLY